MKFIGFNRRSLDESPFFNECLLVMFIELIGLICLLVNKCASLVLKLSIGYGRRSLDRSVPLFSILTLTRFACTLLNLIHCCHILLHDFFSIIIFKCNLNSRNIVLRHPLLRLLRSCWHLTLIAELLHHIFDCQNHTLA